LSLPSFEVFREACRVVVSVIDAAEPVRCFGCYGRDACDACDRDALSRVIDEDIAENRGELERLWTGAVQAERKREEALAANLAAHQRELRMRAECHAAGCRWVQGEPETLENGDVRVPIAFEHAEGCPTTKAAFVSRAMRRTVERMVEERSIVPATPVPAPPELHLHDEQQTAALLAAEGLTRDPVIDPEIARQVREAQAAAMAKAREAVPRRCVRCAEQRPDVDPETWAAVAIAGDVCQACFDADVPF
jgi:hypothetical protein